MTVYTTMESPVGELLLVGRSSPRGVRLERVAMDGQRHAPVVLKYRLYEIDRLISRTVAYAIVTGLLVGVYAGLMLLATHVLPLRGSVAVAGSTLVAAALFTPLRQRVQRVVDRRFNRTRYDAELMITAFAARLQDATDLDAVRTDPTSTVHRAPEPVHLSSGSAARSGNRRCARAGRWSCLRVAYRHHQEAFGNLPPSIPPGSIDPLQPRRRPAVTHPPRVTWPERRSV